MISSGKVSEKHRLSSSAATQSMIPKCRPSSQATLVLTLSNFPGLTIQFN